MDALQMYVYFVFTPWVALLMITLYLILTRPNPSETEEAQPLESPIVEDLHGENFIENLGEELKHALTVASTVDNNEIDEVVEKYKNVFPLLHSHLDEFDIADKVAEVHAKGYTEMDWLHLLADVEWEKMQLRDDSTNTVYLDKEE